MCSEETLVDYCTELLEKFTGSIRLVEEPDDPTRPILHLDLEHLDDFATNDPRDVIFEEYDNPLPSETPFDWKLRRPTFLKSVLHSAFVVFQMTLFGGIVMGCFAVGLAYVHMSTVDLCHWLQTESEVPKILKDYWVIGGAVSAFSIQFWQFFLLWTVFKWPLLKQLNLLTFTLLVALSDVSYRLFLYVSDFYRSPWNLYPLRALFLLQVFYSSYTVARSVFPHSRAKSLKIAFKISAQFPLGIISNFVVQNHIFPWYIKQPPGFGKFVTASLIPFISLPLKVISRLCAIHLDGVNHPGTSFAFVSVAYAGPSLSFRTLQADLENFKLFVALSLGHGILYTFERLTVAMRDYLWQKLGRYVCYCCCYLDGDNRDNQRHRYYRTPRSQRLIADISIQAMLFETTAFVYSIGAVHMYAFIYGSFTASPKQEKLDLVVQLAKRLGVGLSLEFIFNTIAVLIQVRYLNVPVLKIWKTKWTSHLVVSIISTIMTVLFFTDYLLRLVRADYEQDGTITLVNNCTMPFR